jgi:isopenicillin N synthase-like dioxygenase
MSAAKGDITAKRGAFHEIPVIDLSPASSPLLSDRKLLAETVYEVCVRVGFFYVRNHGVPESVINDVFSAAKDFFALPIEDKMAIHVSGNAHFRGYTPLMVWRSFKDAADG